MKSVKEIRHEYGVHPDHVGPWSSDIQEQVRTQLFGQRGPKPMAAHRELELLYCEMGKVKAEPDWPRTVPDQTVMIGPGWIDPGDPGAVVKQCVQTGVSRATVHSRPEPRLIDDLDLLNNCLIDEEDTRQRFHGACRMAVLLLTVGHLVNRGRVQRLMRLMGLAGMTSGPNTGRPHPECRVNRHLLPGALCRW